jgi:hypothetical protein
MQMEGKGIATDRGNRNREAEVTNKALRELEARIVKLQNWVEKEARDAAKQRTERASRDTLAGIIEARLADPLPDEIRGRRGSDKATERVMGFLNENKIQTMPELMGIVRGMYMEQDDLRERLKPIERRMKALAEHIKQGETYLAHRPLCEQYQNQKPRKRNKFYEANRAGLAPYKAAERYLGPVLNGRPLPLRSWKDEYAKLAIKRDGIYRNSFRLCACTFFTCHAPLINESPRNKSKTVGYPPKVIDLAVSRGGLYPKRSRRRCCL